MHHSQNTSALGYYISTQGTSALGYFTSTLRVVIIPETYRAIALEGRNNKVIIWDGDVHHSLAVNKL